MDEDLFKEIDKREIFLNLERDQGFSKQKYLISYDKEKWMEEVIKSGIRIDENITKLLYQQYGRGSIEILKMIKENESLKERIIEENDFIIAEILYILKNELTPHLIDLFCRRTEMSIFIPHQRQTEAANIVAELMASEYNWNEEIKNKEINTYLDYVRNTISFML